MIIGSGFVANAFACHNGSLANSCLYAAGVSNSLCRDRSEFIRDKERLFEALCEVDPSKLFVYFSTCSIDDPSQSDNSYVIHKAALEERVREREHHLVVRVPQLAGFSANPNTILNFLYARISRSEPFELWRFASRNIIDVADVVQIVLHLVLEQGACDETINVAGSANSTMFEIVHVLEQVTKQRALYTLVDRGADWSIDTSRIADAVRACGIRFDDHYLVRTIEKYYGQNLPGRY